MDEMQNVLASISSVETVSAQRDAALAAQIDVLSARLEAVECALQTVAADLKKATTPKYFDIAVDGKGNVIGAQTIHDLSYADARADQIVDHVIGTQAIRRQIKEDG